MKEEAQVYTMILWDHLKIKVTKRKSLGPKGEPGNKKIY